MPANPSDIGPAVGKAAQGVIGDNQAAINAPTRPLYDDAAQARVGLPVQQALESDPLYARTLEEIRADPALNRTIDNLPNDSPGVIDLVQRRLRDARTAPIEAAEIATGSQRATSTAPATAGTYEAARAQQAALRQQYLEPLLNGPIGKLAKEDISTRQAADALFPQNPIPNSASEVLRAVKNLNNKNPWAARQLVRAHLEGAFNEATQKLQSGPNQFGGATFSAAIRGNPQQAANLSAAIQALHGPEVLNGFDKALRIMEATGQRQRIGSQTAFNQELRDHMKFGGAVAQSAPIIVSAGTKLPGRLEKAYERWNLGRNTEQIAHILTDPKGAEAFRHLALAPANSAKATYFAGRIAALALEGSRSRESNKMSAPDRPRFAAPAY
jgi:hypothetical protein